MADIFDVIADSTRREILQVLREDAAGSDMSVSSIVQALGVSQPTVSKHLKVLREAGLVAVREEGQHRLYRLETEPLEAIDDWLVPFFIDEDDIDDIVERAYEPLPESAEKTADFVGRAAANAKRVLTAPFRKLGS